MASSSTTSPINLSVLVLSVFLISLRYSAVNVKAINEEQYAKINKFCSNIPSPEECKKCICSDARARTAAGNNRGLAAIAVKCTSEPMVILLDYLHSLHDEALKTIVEDCSLPLEKAGDVFAYIDGKIEGNNYGDAQLSAHKIQTWLSHCFAVFSRHGEEEFFRAEDLVLNVIRPSDNLVNILGNLASEGGKHALIS